MNNATFVWEPLYKHLLHSDTALLHVRRLPNVLSHNGLHVPASRCSKVGASEMKIKRPPHAVASKTYCFLQQLQTLGLNRLSLPMNLSHEVVF